MACGKHTYPTKKEAKKARKRINREKDFGLTNIYFCDDCQSYHLTTMNKKQSRNLTKKGPVEKLHVELQVLRNHFKRHN